MSFGGLLVAAAGLLAGCGDACDELDDMCADCDDSAVAITCAVLVGEDNADACQRQLDDATFQQSCP